MFVSRTGRSTMMHRRLTTIVALCVLLALSIFFVTANEEDAIAMGEAAAMANEDEGDALLSSASCDITSDCTDMGIEESVCRGHECVPLGFIPRSSVEIYGSLTAFLSVILAAGSGLGGGGLLVPVYILTMGLSSHEAIPLSKATIFGSSIASFIINVGKRHPLSHNRPLIDYETVLLLEPMTLAGTIIGVNMNAVFPEWLITVCIFWLLTKTSLRTFAKGKKIWAEEAAVDRQKLLEITSYWRLLPHESKFKKFRAVARAYLKWKAYKRPSSSVVIKISRKDEMERSSLASTVLSSSDIQEDESSDENSEDEMLMNAGVKKADVLTDHMPSLEELNTYRNRIPKGDVVVLFMTWIGLVLFSLAKGGHGRASIVGLTCGSVGYWSLISLSFPLFVLVTMYYGTKIARVHTFLRATGYEYLKGDMVWSKEAVIKYPALCTAAGLAAGLLGIGGGMVKGPLLLEMGLLPQVSSATSSSMILFTSSATTVQFIVMGTLSVEHALWNGIVGFVAGIIGQYGISYLIRKYRKTAFVIFLIAAVVGSSGFVMGILGTIKVTTVGIGGFRPLCPAI